MERVTILHDEFAPASGQTGVEFHPGTWFEFGRGEGNCRANHVTRNCRSLFMRWPQSHSRFCLSVRANIMPSAWCRYPSDRIRAIIQLAGVAADTLSAGGVHFFPHIWETFAAHATLGANRHRYHYRCDEYNLRAAVVYGWESLLQLGLPKVTKSIWDRRMGFLFTG